MCDFDLERRKEDRDDTGKAGRLFDTGDRPHTAKYLLDWIVRIAIVIITVLSAATFAHIRKVSDRTHSLELALEEQSHALETRIIAVESNRFTSRDGQEVWRAIAERPTREEISADLSEIKQMIRDLDKKVDP